MSPSEPLALVFTCWSRPWYLRRALDSWAAVRGVGAVPMFFSVDPSPVSAQQVDLILKFAEAVDASRLDLVVNPERLGVLANPHAALSAGFERADFAVLAEEDVVVSDDLLEYMAWAAAGFRGDRVMTVNAFWNGPPGPACAAARARHFSPLVWGTWRDRWEEYLSPTWDFDYSSGSPAGAEAGWDWNIRRRVMPRAGMDAVFPLQSRSRHIGEQGGVHYRPEEHAAETAPTAFSPARERCRYSVMPIR